MKGAETFEPVLVECIDRIALVMLNRPAQMNAINDAMRDHLVDLLPRLDQNSQIDAVVLAGAGERAFCAGRDIRAVGAARVEDLVDTLERQHALYRAVRHMKKPTVCAFHGVAAGAGFQLGLCADLRVASPLCRLGQPEVKAGLASIVGTFLMTLHVGAGLNAQLSLSGELISGARAHHIGLVNELTEGHADAIRRFAVEHARRLAAVPDVAYRATKRRLRELSDPGFEEACVAAVRYQLECFASGAPQRIAAQFLSDH